MREMREMLVAVWRGARSGPLPWAAVTAWLAAAGIGVGALWAPAAGQTPPPRLLEERISEIMEQYHALGQFEGAYLVAGPDGLLVKDGLGEANREWGVLNAPDTKFNLGSVTKQFTAALVLALVDDGLVHPDSTISAYLPEYRSDVGRSVTIHHLLTHRGGFFLPRMSQDEYNAFFRERHTTAELLEALTGTDPRYEPDARFAYSSAGYIVLGAIVERVTGMPWADALRSRLLEPLGMEDTGVDDNEAVVPRRASGYRTNYGWGNATFKYYPNSFSAGSLYSTVEDLHRWDLALRDGRILSDDARALLFQRHTVSHRGHYGYGWFLTDLSAGDDTLSVAFHAGDNSGFSALVLRSLETEHFVALLTNTEGTHYYEIAFNLLGVLNGADPVEPRVYIADALRKAVYTEGVQAAVRRYREMRAAGLDHFNQDLDELVELGYDLAYAGRPGDAVEILRITTEIHPDAPSAHLSLGEALEEMGRTQEALSSYRRALAVAPEDEDARAAVTRLGGGSAEGGSQPGS